MRRVSLVQSRLSEVLGKFRQRKAASYEADISDLINATISNNPDIIRGFLDMLTKDPNFTKLLDTLWTEAILGDDPAKYPEVDKVVEYLSENYPTVTTAVQFPTKEMLKRAIEIFAEGYKI